MNKLKRIWAAAAKLARPFDSQIVKDEPAISAAVVGAAAFIGVNLGFTLSPGASAAIGALVLAAVGAFTRQSVQPVPDPTPPADPIQDGELTEADDWQYPVPAYAEPTGDPIPEGG